MRFARGLALTVLVIPVGVCLTAVDALGNTTGAPRSPEPSTKVRDISNDPALLVEIGLAHEDKGEYREALEMLQRAVALRPHDGLALRNIGFVLLQLGEPETAIQPLLEAIAIDRDDWKAHANLAVAYTSTRAASAEESSALMGYMAGRAMMQDDPVQRRWRELVAKTNTMNYPALALEQAREAARCNPDEVSTWYELGKMLTEGPTRSPLEAIDAYKRALRLAPDHLLALRDLAKLQMDQREYADAKATCATIVRHHGEDLWLLQMRGDLALSTKNFAEAEKHFVAWVAADDGNAEAHFRLAWTYRKLNRAEESQRELDRAKELRPSMAPWYDGQLKHMR